MNQQLELGFGGIRSPKAASRRERRVSRAAWWFAHMRHIVESAMDWEPAPEARPEQIWMSNARRQIKL
jgi:hypothetical protein